MEKQDFKAKPDLAFGVSVEGKVRILQCVRGTRKLVIGDDVQL